MEIVAGEKNIGMRLRMSESARIECQDLIIGNDVVIDDRVKIICKNGRVVIGDQTYIGADTTIMLHNFEIGEYCKLHNHALLNGKGSVYIGHNGWFGQNSVLNGEAELRIGNNVGIGTYSSVWTHGYFGQLVDGCNLYSIKSTVIEDDAWLIGSYNTIFPGVTIGKGAVLMGTSVVTKSIEGGKVFGGNPAKDLTDKIGYPYTPISFDRKMELIREHLGNYLHENKIAFHVQENIWRIPQFGCIQFGGELKSNEAECIALFEEEVKQWRTDEHISQFCMTTKFYNKRYSPLEVMIRKVLNAAVARFIPR